MPEECADEEVTEEAHDELSPLLATFSVVVVSVAE